MRPLSELIDTTDPGLAQLEAWLASARNPVERLPCEPADAERTLLALQVTTRSLLGTLGHETGGLLVDGGWLRVLGAGSPRLPRDLAGWNRIGETPVRAPGALLCGDDAVGGFFAVNGGALPARPGNVCYLPPDSLEWEDMELGHSAWVHWACAGDLERFYDNVRWPSWREDLRGLGPDQGFLFDPFLVADAPSLEARTRSPVSMEELWRLHALELPRQLAATAGDGPPQ